jgi:hypothetical protein
LSQSLGYLGESAVLSPALQLFVLGLIKTAVTSKKRQRQYE